MSHLPRFRCELLRRRVRELGRDRPRTRALAELAAAAYEAAGDTSRKPLAEVRAWLAAHTP